MLAASSVATSATNRNTVNLVHNSRVSEVVLGSTQLSHRECHRPSPRTEIPHRTTRPRSVPACRAAMAMALEGEFEERSAFVKVCNNGRKASTAEARLVQVLQTGPPARASEQHADAAAHGFVGPPVVPRHSAVRDAHQHMTSPPLVAAFWCATERACAAHLRSGLCGPRTTCCARPRAHAAQWWSGGRASHESWPCPPSANPTAHGVPHARFYLRRAWRAGFTWQINKGEWGGQPDQKFPAAHHRKRNAGAP